MAHSPAADRLHLMIHASIVTGTALLLVALDLLHPDSPPDANIGAGLVGLFLAGLGLPWSLVLFDSEATGRTLGVLVAATALANVALHALVRWLLAIRRRTAQS